MKLSAEKKAALPDGPGKTAPRLEPSRTIIKDRGLPDLPFLLLTVMLVIIGLIILYSASYPRASNDPDCNFNGAYYFVRQLGFAVAGLGFLWLASIIHSDWLRLFSGFIMAIAILCLILVLFIGTIANGSRRWLNLGLFSFQPSEVAKAAVVIYFAALSLKFGNKMQDLHHGFLLFLPVLAVISLLMVAEPHLSGTIIICLIGAIMMLMGGTRLRYFIITLLSAALILLLLRALLPETFNKLLMRYAQDRIMAWRDPEAYADDESYQIVQSLYAIGSGGLTGLGLGKSRQKYLYLPEEHNDYIFAIACEELGFVGAALILLLFALLIWRGYWIALHASGAYASLLAAGFTTLLAIQVLLNIAVVTNLIPATGISLPFFSYGGTALLLNLTEMGVVLGVSRQKKSKME